MTIDRWKTAWFGIVERNVHVLLLYTLGYVQVDVARPWCYLLGPLYFQQEVRFFVEWVVFELLLWVYYGLEVFVFYD